MLKSSDASALPNSIPISTCPWAGAEIKTIHSVTTAPVRPSTRVVLWRGARVRMPHGAKGENMVPSRQKLVSGAARGPLHFRLIVKGGSNRMLQPARFRWGSQVGSALFWRLAPANNGTWAHPGESGLLHHRLRPASQSGCRIRPGHGVQDRVQPR